MTGIQKELLKEVKQKCNRSFEVYGTQGYYFDLLDDKLNKNKATRIKRLNNYVEDIEIIVKKVGDGYTVKLKEKNLSHG